MADALCPSCRASEFQVKAVEPFAILFCHACGHILAIAPQGGDPKRSAG